MWVGGTKMKKPTSFSIDLVSWEKVYIEHIFSAPCCSFCPWFLVVYGVKKKKKKEKEWSKQIWFFSSLLKCRVLGFFARENTKIAEHSSHFYKQISDNFYLHTFSKRAEACLQQCSFCSTSYVPEVLSSDTCIWIPCILVHLLEIRNGEGKKKAFKRKKK